MVALWKHYNLIKWNSKKSATIDTGNGSRNGDGSKFAGIKPIPYKYYSFR
jgi:hypothetical protein